MTGFFGKHNAKVDDKGRLVIPSGIKSVVPADQMEFVIRKDMYSNCLEMYTKQEWANMSQAVRAKLDLAFDEDHMRYWRTYMSDTVTVVPDAKLGRITIPKEILEKAGIEKEVIFLGVDYKVEIWAKEELEGGSLNVVHVCTVRRIYPLYLCRHPHRCRSGRVRCCGTAG